MNVSERLPGPGGGRKAHLNTQWTLQKGRKGVEKVDKRVTRL